MDRIDLIVNVSRVPNEALLVADSLINNQHLTASDSIKRAFIAQKERYKSSIIYNASLSNSDIKKYAPLSDDAKSLLLKAADSLKLSARSYFKIIKIARTIADLAGEKDISTGHISEALQYRK